jgi:hypothetical protein
MPVPVIPSRLHQLSYAPTNVYNELLFINLKHISFSHHNNIGTTSQRNRLLPSPLSLQICHSVIIQGDQKFSVHLMIRVQNHAKIF